MKLKAILAAAVSAAVTLCSMGMYFPNAETSTETPMYTLSYNLEYDGFRTEDESQFVSVELKAGANYIIPEGDFLTDDFASTGWTYDNILMYQAGDNFVMPAHDVVLEPVFAEIRATATYTVSYDVEGYELPIPDAYEPMEKNPGHPVSPTSVIVYSPDATQIGWLYKGVAVLPSQKIVMPEEDVVFTPRMFNYYNVTYSAGDVDRITTASSVSFECFETEGIDLAAADRLGRMGFKLTGWTCSVDGKVYKPVSQYVMPGSDVVFTAVWEPLNYVVVFMSNNGKNENIKVPGVTDSTITVPECTSTKAGYKFAGWSYGDEVYQPGDDFVIYGAMPGLGISLKAIWVEDTGEEEQEPCDAIWLAMQRQAYVNGEITAEELKSNADFLLGR